MPWIIAIVAGLVLGAVLVSSRTARNALITVAVIFAIAAAWIIFSEERSEQRAHTLIGADEIELRTPQVERRGGLFYVVASVKNLSASHDTETIKLKILAHDCPTATLSDACEIVGERLENLRLVIPPGQVRGIDRLSSFSNMPQVENLVWSFEVMEVRARTR